MTTGVTVKGLREVQKNFEKFKLAADGTTGSLFEFVGKQTVDLLKQNTPVDTGQLRDSWYIMLRTQNRVDIGLPEDQYEKLVYLINGTQYMAARPNFVFQIFKHMQIATESKLMQELKKRHKWWGATPSSGRGISASDANRSRISGLGNINRSRAYRVRQAMTTGVGRVTYRRRISKVRLLQRRGRSIPKASTTTSEVGPYIISLEM